MMPRADARAGRTGRSTGQDSRGDEKEDELFHKHLLSVSHATGMLRFPSPMFSQRLNDRLSLRQLALNDTEELFAVVDRNRAYLRRWLPWLDRTHSPADTRAFLEGALRQSDNNQSFQAAILCGERMAGVIGYHRIDWTNRHTSLGYWLAEEFQGHGFMTASCRALVDHAFAALNLNRITIACATGNTRSRAIPQRLGFVHEGTLRDAEWLYDQYIDHEVYSQLQREWQAQMIATLAAKNSAGRSPAHP
jgi:ribosomal-protein-serine acetyltransferase